ncbi:MAG: hypothetical protein JNK82_06320 [Myxococcaceae bacterium]|nr:hypothetical protein [Myxococcaceae bacterium]
MGEPFALQKQSINAELLLELIRDRAQRVALLAVGDAIKTAGGRDAQRNFVRPLLEGGALVISDAIALKKVSLDAFLRDLAHAFFAGAFVAITFGDDAALEGERWKSRFGSSTPPPPSDHRAGARALLVEWTYLHTTSLFGPTLGPRPECGETLAKPEFDFCKQLAQLSDADMKAGLGLDTLRSTLDLLGHMTSRAKVDVPALAAALKSGSLGSLDEAGLNSNEWQTLSKKVDELRPLLQKSLALQTALQDVANSLSKGEKASKRLKDTSSAASSALKALSTTDLTHLLPLDVSTDLTVWLDQLRASGDERPAPGPFTVEELQLIAERIELANRLLEECLALRHWTRELDRLRADTRHLPKDATKLDAWSLPSAGELLKVVDGAFRALASYEQLARLVPTLKLSPANELVTKLNATRSLVFGLQGFPGNGDLASVFTGFTAFADDERTRAFLALVWPVIQQLSAGRLDSRVTWLKLATTADVRAWSRVLSNGDSDVCASATSAGCWSLKLAEVVQSSISVTDNGILLDGARVADGLATVGDRFRQQSHGHFFFHLTLGMGALWSFLPPQSGASSRWTPQVSEQIGAGYAQPIDGQGRLTLKVAGFFSGILYRLVLDSRESDAVMAGVLFAADFYE